MSAEKEKEAMQGTDEEKANLNNHDADGTLPHEEANHAGNELDNSRARFISSEKDGATPEGPEVYVDVDGKVKMQEQFVGLTKEELMKFADDPYWKRVRLALLITFWVGWFGMLVAAIVIIVVAPKCPPRPDLAWWQEASVYKIFPKSFKDSDADGIGDLKGVHQKLGYLTGNEESLNVSAVLLSSIFATDNAGITDFQAVHPTFGTMDEFKDLRVAMHKSGMKLILDYEPNHSSNKHEWFTKSAARDQKYEGYYIWQDARNVSGSRQPPNDLKNNKGESAWTFDVTRGQYYFHQFAADQPDLNFRNADVISESEAVLQFWLDAGVDGFQVRHAQSLFECAELGQLDATAACTQVQAETYGLITQWRRLLDAFSSKTEKVKFIMVENGGTANQTSHFMEYEGAAGAHMTGNLDLLSLDASCKAQCMLDKINARMVITDPIKMWNSWQIGSQDTSRALTRLGGDRQYVDALNLLVMTLPGTSFTYYGEEIGMSDVPLAVTVDEPALAYRTPMQWTPEEMAGFTSGNSTWVPIADDYRTVNVKTQLATGAASPNIETYFSLMGLREEPSMQWGITHVGVAGEVLFYVRQAERFPGMLVALNLGDFVATVDFVNNAHTSGLVANPAEVVAHTDNVHSPELQVGSSVNMANLAIGPLEGLVFKF